MDEPVVVVAGSTGDLGVRIVSALRSRGATVRALVRPGADTARLTGLGATVHTVDLRDEAAVAAACDGATCVVSALNGLRDVIVDTQTVLLQAAVRAGVPRFVPSDFSLDFTRTTPGGNRNLDLRREFMARVDAAPIAATSVLNGAFADLLDGQMPVVQRRVRRVLHWGSADQPLDFTTRDDVASYAAAAALDPAAPRLLRVAGDSVSTVDLASTLTDLTGARFRPFRVGSVRTLDLLIGVARRVAPQPDATFPAWQGMQYVRDMSSGQGQLSPLDNARYPEVSPTPVREVLASA